MNTGPIDYKRCKAQILVRWEDKLHGKRSGPGDMGGTPRLERPAPALPTTHLPMWAPTSRRVRVVLNAKEPRPIWTGLRG